MSAAVPCPNCNTPVSGGVPERSSEGPATLYTCHNCGKMFLIPAPPARPA